MAKIWTNPRDWISGEIVTEAMMDAHVRDNTDYLHAEIFDSTLSVAAATISIASIPSGYAHLRLGINGRCDRAGVAQDSVAIQFNGDTGANYDWHSLYGNTAAVAGAEGYAATMGRLGLVPGATATAGVSSILDVVISDYLQTTFQKSVHSRFAHKEGTAAGGIYVGDYASFWRSTTAITSITLRLASGSNFIAGTRVTLHGIAT